MAKQEITIEYLYNKMNERFDAVDQRLDAIDQRFDAIDERFDTLELHVRYIKSEIIKIQAVTNYRDKYDSMNQKIPSKIG